MHQEGSGRQIENTSHFHCRFLRNQPHGTHIPLPDVCGPYDSPFTLLPIALSSLRLRLRYRWRGFWVLYDCGTWWSPRGTSGRASSCTYRSHTLTGDRLQVDRSLVQEVKPLKDVSIYDIVWVWHLAFVLLAHLGGCPDDLTACRQDPSTSMVGDSGPGL